MERDVEIRDNKIESLKNELEELKKEKESIDHKLAGFGNASKDLNDLLESQKFAKDKTGVGFNEYTTVPPPPAQVYSPPKNDLSWTGLPEFVDDTVTDYSRPTPSIDVSKDVSESVSFFEQRGSVGNVFSKPMISFVKEIGCPSVPKVINTKSSRKPTVKYAEMYRKTINTAKPKAVHNDVKASTCWVWKPKNRVGKDDFEDPSELGSEKMLKFMKITLGQMDARLQAEVMRIMIKSAAKTKDKEERQRISRAECLIQDLLQKIFMKAKRSR
ncbi:hypothetical protein Tco_1531699 [Tanacetum coccineum]